MSWGGACFCPVSHKSLWLVELGAPHSPLKPTPLVFAFVNMLQKALLCRLKGENKSVGTKELPQGTQSLSFLGGGWRRDSPGVLSPGASN